MGLVLAVVIFTLLRRTVTHFDGPTVFSQTVKHMELKKSKFYVYWSISFLIVVAVAFTPKYWVPLLSQNVSITPGIHFHTFCSYPTLV